MKYLLLLTTVMFADPGFADGLTTGSDSSTASEVAHYSKRQLSEVDAVFTHYKDAKSKEDYKEGFCDAVFLAMPRYLMQSSSVSMHSSDSKLLKFNCDN